MCIFGCYIEAIPRYLACLIQFQTSSFFFYILHLCDAAMRFVVLLFFLV